MRYSYTSYYVELSAKLRKEDTISTDKIITQLNQRYEDFNNENAYKIQSKEFKELGFYQWRGIKYFLYQYEMYLKENSKTDRDKIDWKIFFEFSPFHIYSIDYKSIEHILPQRGKRPCWVDALRNYTANEKKIIKNTIGNLVPLSTPKNSSLSNECFESKIEHPKHDSVGFRYGSYSENELTKFREWTPTQILMRSVKLIKFMNKHWKLDIGKNNTKDIITFLNLDFIVEKENLEIEKEKIIKVHTLDL